MHGNKHILFFFLLFITTSLPLLAGQEKVRAKTKWSAQSFVFLSYSDLQALNDNYDNTGQSLSESGSFSTENISKQYYNLGGQFDFLYHLEGPYILGIGGSLILDFPGQVALTRVSRKENITISHSLANYLINIKFGQELLRSQYIFIRGFFEVRAGLGSLSIIETISGSDFGAARSNNTRLSTLTWGAAVNIDVMYRWNLHNGFLFGLKLGFLTYNNWRGTDAVGNEGRLISVPLASDKSKGVLQFLPDGKTPNADINEVSFLIPEYSFMLGYWQAI